MSSAITELNSYSHQEPQDIVSRGKDREREDQSEDALLVLTSKIFPLLLLKRVRRIFRDLLMKLKTEDLDPRELVESESSMELRKLREKRLLKAHAL